MEKCWEEYGRDGVEMEGNGKEVVCLAPCESIHLFILKENERVCYSKLIKVTLLGVEREPKVMSGGLVSDLEDQYISILLPLGGGCSCINP